MVNILHKFRAHAEVLLPGEYSLSVKAIEDLINNASVITGQCVDEVLDCADFDEKNRSIEKIEAIFAELRAILFLNNNNFKKIKLLKSFKKKKNPDIYAEILNEGFDVEVACLTAEHSRGKEGSSYRLDGDKFLREFTDRMKKKVGQLNEGENSRKMFIFVINRYPEKALMNEQEYREVIKKAYSQSGLSNNYYIGLVTGNEDFIYPDLG